MNLLTPFKTLAQPGIGRQTLRLLTDVHGKVVENILA